MSITRADALSYSEVEAIVRVVLQRLRSAQSAQSNVARPNVARRSAAEPNNVPSLTPNSSPHSPLRLEQPLLTLEHLRDNWNGLRIVQVPARCVVTPAVVDELRQRGVVLERFANSTAADAAHTDGASAKLLVLASKHNHSGLAGQLAGSGVNLHWLDHNSPDPASQELALAAVGKHVTPSADRFCLWCTTRPFAALQACCQDAHVRVVQLPQLEDLPRAVEQARPNVIVVDSSRWGTSAIAQLVRNWTRSFAQL